MRAPKAHIAPVGTTLTAINPEKIARLRDEEMLDVHERLHQLFDLALVDGDEELAQRAKRAHQLYRYEMLQRGIDHPYLDDMDGVIHATEALDEPPHPDDAEANTNASPHDTGIMLAFFLPPELGQEIAMEGGEAPEDLHLTLVYLGHTDDWSPEQLQQLPGLVSVYTANSQPMSGSLSGMGRFAASPSSDSRDVLYHSVDAPDLPAWRQGLVDWLEDGGFPQKSEHGYTPHVTLKYLPTDEPSTIEGLEARPVEFRELVCKIGDQCYRFPLAGRQAMRPQKWADRLLAQQETLHESRTSRTGVFSDQVRRPAAPADAGEQLRGDAGHGVSESHEDQLDETLPADQLGQLYVQEVEHTAPIIYGVLLVPDTPDLDGDRFPAEVIAKACAEYSNRLEADEQHRFANPDLEVVDSFIAPEGYKLAGNPVQSGSWIVGIRSTDPAVIDKVKHGDYRGLSIDGSAVVRPHQERSLESLASVLIPSTLE
jgi:2'-5' RNA ligase